MRFELHIEAFNELRNSPEISQMLKDAADRIAADAGDGFEAGPVIHGKTRAHVNIHTTDYLSRVQNARDDTLMRSLDAGR